MFSLATIDKILELWLKKDRPVIEIARQEIGILLDSLVQGDDIDEYNMKVTTSTIHVVFKKGNQSYHRLIVFQGGIFHSYDLIHTKGQSLSDAYDRAMRGI